MVGVKVNVGVNEAVGDGVRVAVALAVAVTEGVKVSVSVGVSGFTAKLHADKTSSIPRDITKLNRFSIEPVHQDCASSSTGQA